MTSCEKEHELHNEMQMKGTAGKEATAEEDSACHKLRSDTWYQASRVLPPSVTPLPHCSDGTFQAPALHGLLQTSY